RIGLIGMFTHSLAVIMNFALVRRHGGPLFFRESVTGPDLRQPFHDFVIRFPPHSLILSCQSRGGPQRSSSAASSHPFTSGADAPPGAVRDSLLFSSLRPYVSSFRTSVTSLTSVRLTGVVLL